MKLHGTPISPYARKVMILARLHGIDLDIIPAKADGSTGYTHGDNPLGKVPALEWTSGPGSIGWLFDSPVICEWLDDRGEAPLLPPERDARTIQQWQHALGDGISDATYNLRYEMARPEALHWPQMIVRHETALIQAVTTLGGIADTLGAPWTYGSLAVVCGLDYMHFRAPHLDWKGRAPVLADWHAQFAKTPEYSETYAYDLA